VVVVWLSIEFYLHARRDLYVVNTNPTPVALYFNYRSPMNLPVGISHLTLAHNRFSVAIGSLTNSWMDVAITNAPGSARARLPIWVLNAGPDTIAIETQMAAESNSSPRLIQASYGEGLMSFPYVEHPFRAASPGSNGSGRGFTTLTVFHGDPAALLPPIESESGPEAAVTFGEWRLRRNPEDENTPLAYVRAAVHANQAARAKSFLTDRLARPVNIGWHQALLSLRKSPKEMEDSMATYDLMLRDQPRDSMLLYLRAMTTSDPAVRRGFLEKSAAADAKNPYAQEALGVDSYLLGRYEEAGPLLAAAVALRPKNGEYVQFQRRCQAMLHQFEEIEPALRADLNQRPLDFDAAYKLCDLLGVKNDPAGVAAVVRAFRTAARESGMPSVMVEADALDWIELFLRGQYALLELKTAGLTQPIARELHFHALIEEGKLSEAATAPEGNDPSAEMVQQLSLGLAWSLAGQDDLERQCYSRALAPLSKLDPRAATILNKESAPTEAELRSVRLSPHERAIFMAVMVRKHESVRALANAEALRESATRLFPHPLIERAANAAGR
jgi:tetratricopeptide (TPR) repeat protein